MGYPDSQNQQGIDELRAILLGDDRQAMDGLRTQLDEQQRQLAENSLKLKQNEELIELLCDRVGDDEKLREAIAPVLSHVVSDVEQTNPRPLARAMSPFIVSSIRSEIANSKEAMVEALYPITGRLVSAAVKNSVASMMETVNQRVDEATSARVLSARFQSWRTGEPVSAYLIPAPGEVSFHSAMLMERDTGAPICHVDPSGNEPQQDGQSNLVSGLLAALSNLTEEVFTGEDDELRTLDMNGRKITLRRSLCHMLVVEFAGTLSAEQHRTIDEKFGEIVSLSESDDHVGLTAELTSLMHDDSSTGLDEAENPKKNAVWAGLGFLLVAFLGWYLWSGWQQQQLENAAQVLRTKIAETPALGAYPIDVLVLQDSKSLHVVGLIPESHDPVALRVQWQEWAEEYPIDTSLAAVADATRSKQLEQELGVLRAENRILRLQDQTSAEQPSLSDQLRHLTESRPFYISADGNLLDDAISSNLLRRVARLLMADDRKMQVVGLVSAQGVNDSSHAGHIAGILRGFGVSAEQLDITARIVEDNSSDNKMVLLELIDETP